MFNHKFLCNNSHPILHRDVLTFTNLNASVPISFIIFSLVRSRIKRNGRQFITTFEESLITQTFIPQKPPAKWAGLWGKENTL